MWMFRRRCSAAASALALLAALAGTSTLTHAQVPEQRGAAEISLVGFRASYSPAARLATSGLSFNFSQYWPHVGLLEGSAEGFLEQGGLRTGTDYLRLSDLRWGGERVSVTWGDFSVDPYPLGMPFLNVPVPRIEANGFYLEMTARRHVYRVFAGRGSLLAGARIPLRYRSGQNIAGAEASWELRDNLSIGSRVVEFSRQDAAALRGIAIGFGRNRELPGAVSAASDLVWKPRREFKVFAEGSYSGFRGGSQRPEPGGIAGVLWESSRWKWHANYARQPASYLPIAAYLVDARSGSFADASFAVTPKLVVYGAASLQYLNTAEPLGALHYRQISNTLGVTARLPWHSDLSAQYTDLLMRSSGNAGQHGRFANISLAKAFTRHTVRLSVRELSISGLASAARQHSLEFGDDVRLGRFTLSGASRWERELDAVHRDALDFRGGIQGTFKGLSLYAQAEAGADLAAKTLFATTVTRSNSFGMQYTIGRNWNISADAWNSRLLVNLNEDTVALLTAGGGLAPILANQNQWSAFLRVSRRLSWGGDYSRSDIAQIAGRATPFTGAVGGVVTVNHPAGPPTPAAGVAIVLDDYRTVSSDAFGRYRFEDVPVGAHRLRIDPRHLPVDFADGDYKDESTTVESQRTVRADFAICAAASLEGRIEAPKGIRLGAMVVRLEPGGHYTFADDTGAFYMDGLPEGEYRIKLDSEETSQTVVLRAAEPAVVHFRFQPAIKELPIHTLSVGSD